MDIISGSYVIEEAEMGGLEIKRYNLTYKIKTAISTTESPYREVANGTALLVRPYRIVVVSSIPLQDLRFVTDDVDSYLNVSKVVDITGKSYEFGSGSVEVELGPATMNQIVDLRIHTWEQGKPPPPLPPEWLAEGLERMLWDTGIDLPLIGRPIKVKHLLLLMGVILLGYVMVRFSFTSKIRKLRIRGGGKVNGY